MAKKMKPQQWQRVIPIQLSLADHRQLYPEGDRAGGLCVGSRTYEAGALPGIHHGTVDQESLLAAENRILRDQLRGRLRLSDGERGTLGEIGPPTGSQGACCGWALRCFSRPRSWSSRYDARS